jgi:AcrR family transcriptional regulator
VGKPGVQVAIENAGEGRREQKKKDKLNRISQAARVLFHAQGFDATTTAQVAERAGIAEGTLFLYVTRKEDLLILAFTEEMAEVVAACFAAVEPGAGFVEGTLAFFSGLFDYHDADRVLAKAFLREVGFLRDPARDYGFGKIPMMPSLAAIADWAKNRGEIGRHFGSLDIAQLAFSAYWLCLRDWANDEFTSDELCERLRGMLSMQVRGLAP